MSAFYELFEMIGNVDSNPLFYLGTVKSGFPNLAIQVNDIVLDSNNLMVDSLLKSSNDITINDTVFLINAGDKFIALSKVVNV